MFTERELGYINDCVMGKRGVLTEAPAEAMPSLLRKGVLKRKGPDLVVQRPFRDLFYTEDALVDIQDGRVVRESDLEERPRATGVRPRRPLERFPGSVGLELDLSDCLQPDSGEECLDRVADAYVRAKRALEVDGEAPRLTEVCEKVERVIWVERLAPAVADYFRVELKPTFGKVRRIATYTGEGHMVIAARAAFNYLAPVAHRLTTKAMNKARRSGAQTGKSYTECAEGFLADATRALSRHVTDVTDEDGCVIGELSAIEASVTE